MTKGGRKRTTIRQGAVRRLTGGRVVMDFIEEVADLGAPEFNVTGTASMERISAGQIRITKYSRRRDGNVVLFHEVWDVQEWLKSWALYEQFRDLVTRLPISDGGDGRRREKH